MIPESHARIFGLDLMRAVAILLVIFSHADDLLDAYWPANRGAAALDGVDVFFVLSGFLIGTILIRMAEANDLPVWRRLLDFWQRRWLRTLPNYYLFLVINMALVYGDIAPGMLHANVLAYFVFLQNFIIPLDLFFWESWSLAVEEWFYLLFPLLLLAGISTFKGFVRPAFVPVVLLMIILSTWLRFPATHAVDTSFTLDLFVRRIVVLRFDTIGYGVLVAWSLYYFPTIVFRWRWWCGVVGVVMLTTTVLYYPHADLMFLGTWHFTSSGVAMALMLPLLVEWRKSGWWGGPVVFLSRISYALYLVHMPVRTIYLHFMEGRSMELSLLLYVGYWVICIALAALVYRAWETPFMALRNRLSVRILAGGRSPH